MFEIIIVVILGVGSFVFGYLIQYKKKYYLIAGYSDLKNKIDFSKDQIRYAHRIALSCFLFGGFFIGLTVVNYLYSIFPKQVINLDFFYILIISLLMAFAVPLLLSIKKSL